MKKENPDKTFYPIEKEMTCMFMKMITLDNLYHCLQNEEYQVTVNKEIADKARLAISRMLAIA
jgi:quinolinate synthase